jgi:hypothetical protein
VSFAAITLCVAPQRVFIVIVVLVVVVYLVMTQSGDFWTYPRMTFAVEVASLCNLISRNNLLKQ